VPRCRLSFARFGAHCFYSPSHAARFVSFSSRCLAWTPRYPSVTFTFLHLSRLKFESWCRWGDLCTLLAYPACYQAEYLSFSILLPNHHALPCLRQSTSSKTIVLASEAGTFHEACALNHRLCRSCHALGFDCLGSIVAYAFLYMWRHSLCTWTEHRSGIVLSWSMFSRFSNTRDRITPFKVTPF